MAEDNYMWWGWEDLPASAPNYLVFEEYPAPTNLTALMQLRQMPSADTIEKYQNALTPEIRYGLERAGSLYGTEARGKFETRRVELNRRMTEIFDEVDIVITASNPDVAFNAEGPLPDTFGGVVAGAGNNGVLTFPANIYGNPGISIPAGNVDGLPVGLQVMGRHFSEQVLLDAALAFERSRPWPLVAPQR